jgi:hypothetical protein
MIDRVGAPGRAHPVSVTSEPVTPQGSRPGGVTSHPAARTCTYLYGQGAPDAA